MDNSLSLLKFRDRKSIKVILQSESAECGLACLAMLADYHGYKRDLSSMRRQFAFSLKGITLRGMLSITENLGFTGRPVRLELDNLKTLKLPCILHWNLSHFVVLEKVTAQKVTIVDPAVGRRTLSYAEVSKSFTGVAFEVTPSSKFQKVNNVKRVRMTDLWKRITGLAGSMTQLFLLAALLQIVALVLPLFNQLVVDEAIVKGDSHFLGILMLGFALISVVQVIISVLRSYVMLHFGNAMSFQLTANLFQHLLRLPPDFFSKRTIGDIQTRFGSLAPVQQLLTTTLISTILDGLMAITTAIVMYIYSPFLALVVCGMLAINLIGTLLIYPVIRARTEELIVASAKQQTTFLDVVRSVTTIKSFGRENERESVWKNTLADEMNQKIRLSKIGIWSGAAESVFFGIGGIFVLGLGAFIVISGDLTVGMLLAFISYQSQFLSKGQNLVNSLFEFKMVGLHLERLADIIHHEPEEEIDALPLVLPLVTGEITFEDVCFRYGDNEPFVLNDINLRINAGGCVVFQGASGSGKSTLIKLMTGILTPTTGVVKIDGVPLKNFGVKNLRSQIGIVSQDDTLLPGTLSENISFFDPEMDQEWIRLCAFSAMIGPEIEAMPMQFESLVGDMGSSLSGGQRQRVLIARALYNKPKILILDEGTANIDTANSDEIIRALAQFEMTKVFVGHDDVALKIEGHRHLWLEDGRLKEIGGAALEKVN